MNLKWIGLSMLSLSLLLVGPAKAKATGVAAGTPAVASGQDRDRDDWNAPPQEFREVQRQGFHDGVEGARKDFEHHRHADFDDRDEYRHPHVPKSERMDYRDGYRRGYEKAMSHLMGEHNPNHY